MLNRFKDPGTLAAEIKMTRVNHSGAVMVVEGVSDIRFWSPRKHEQCELVDGEGKNNVVGCFHRLDSLEFSGVLGIVDSDFDSLEKTQICSENLLQLDAHDLECLLCRSSALETVLAEYGTVGRINRFIERGGVDVRTSLLKRALVFGRLRWALLRLGLSVDSKLISVPRFVDYHSWSVEIDELISTVESETSSEGKISAQIDSLPPADPWHIAHGPDMIELLRIGLSNVLGKLGKTTGIKDILRVLRSAVPIEEIRSTKFGKDIRRWELRNSPFKVLPG